VHGLARAFLGLLDGLTLAQVGQRTLRLLAGVAGAQVVEGRLGALGRIAGPQVVQLAGGTLAPVAVAEVPRPARRPLRTGRGLAPQARGLVGPLLLAVLALESTTGTAAR